MSVPTLPCCGRPESAIVSVRVIEPGKYEGKCICGSYAMLSFIGSDPIVTAMPTGGPLDNAHDGPASFGSLSLMSANLPVPSAEVPHLHAGEVQ